MSTKRISNLPKYDTYRCIDLRLQEQLSDSVQARHQEIFGFDQNAFSNARIVLVGAGGINGEVGEGLVRKGIGDLTIFDGDTVDMTNLNRQRFFVEDLEKNKALVLAKNLALEGFMGSSITGYAGYVQEFASEDVLEHADLIVCGVDNDQTRVFLSDLGLKRKVPVIFLAVSRDANQGYVFVQENGGPCFGCVFPDAVGNETTPCPGIPAIKDILKVVAGVALYSADTVLMSRKRDWNFRMIQLAGFMADDKRWLHRRPQCQLCSTQEGVKDDRAETCRQRIPLEPDRTGEYESSSTPNGSTKLRK